MEEREKSLKLLTNQPIKPQIKSWRSISLPSKVSLSKDLSSKPPSLIEQFLGGAQGLSTFFRVEECVPLSRFRCRGGW
jgi:hypothetical protein